MALTSAEKQRAYRDRQREKLAVIGNVTVEGSVGNVTALTSDEVRVVLTDCGYYAVCERLSLADRRQFIAFCIGELMADVFNHQASLSVASVLIAFDRDKA